MENEQADAGLEGQTRLARPNSQARSGTRKKTVFPVQLTTSRIGKPYPVDVDPYSPESANYTCSGPGISHIPTRIRLNTSPGWPENRSQDPYPVRGYIDPMKDNGEREIKNTLITVIYS